MAETTVTLSPNQYSFYFKTLLDSAEKELVYWDLGKRAMHPKKTGTDSYMLKYGNVAASTNTLTEGVVPTAATIDTNKYTISLNQYGQWIALTDWLDLTAIDDVFENVSERLGYCAGLSTDTVIRDMLIANATTSIQYSGSGNTTDNNIAANETLVAPDALKASRILSGADAPRFSDGCYVWIVHPLQAHDIMADTSAGGFIELNKYVQGLADKPLKGEMGKVYGARIVQTSNVASAANNGSVNVYRSMMLAKDAFVVTTLDKNHVQLITKPVDSGGIANPLNQVGSVGYKLQFGSKYVGGTFTNSNSASPDLCLQIRSAASGG